MNETEIVEQEQKLLICSCFLIIKVEKNVRSGNIQVGKNVVYIIA